MEPEPVGVKLEVSDGSETETVKELMGRLEERVAVLVHEARHLPDGACPRFDVT